MADYKTAIQTHGASAIYRACIARLNGNRDPLLVYGLDLSDLGAVNDLMSAAYRSMSKADQAADYWDASKNA